MNVDLLPIINNEGQKLTFSGTVSFEDYGCKISCDVSGHVLNFAGRLELSAAAEALVDANCARCLKPVTERLHVDIRETVGEEGAALCGTVLDVAEVVKASVLVELPIRYLCSPGCKGICSRCGADLNVAQCSCRDDSVDERLAKLKDLLDHRPE